MTVTVVVTRNEFKPKFDREEYKKDQLSEKTSVGTVILTVHASDRDGVGLGRMCSKFS